MQLTHAMRYYHFFIVEIIRESVKLIRMSKKNQTYHPDGEQLGFYWKSAYQNTQTEQKGGYSRSLRISRNEEFIRKKFHLKQNQMSYLT